MSRIAYVNGRYLAHRDARVHIEDRGYQFADGCYEVVAMRNGVFIDAGLHLQRLRRSLAALRIDFSMNDAALMVVMNEVARRNRVARGLRLSADHARRRDARFRFPGQDAAKPRDDRALEAAGRSEAHGERHQGHHHSGSALGAARYQIGLATAQRARARKPRRQAGAFEAWQVDRDGNVTEGTSSNAWIVTKAGEVVTRQADQGILNGVTRLGLLRVIARVGAAARRAAVQRRRSQSRAPKRFFTSSTNFVVPVVRIDDAPVGDGKPGPLAKKLAASYADYALVGGSDKA